MARETGLGSIRELSRSIRKTDQFGDSIEVVAVFEQDWRSGRNPDLEQAWERGGRSLTLLSALVKIEIIARFENGESPTVREYLDRFPELQAADEQVISLLYEEYCLLEEGGQAPPVDQFCQQYRSWADSLASQLRYHRLLSQVAMMPTPSKAAAPVYPQPGQWFAGQFLVRRILGVGGAGRVYLADQPEFERQVALKVSPDLGREHAIQGRLDHDHVMPVWSVFTDETTGLRGICMPFRPGCPLDMVVRHLHEARPPTGASDLMAVLDRECEKPGSKDGWRDYPHDSPWPSGVAWIGLVIARALAHAHERGVVHRDVKPANIFLAVREGPQLLDFNLAHAPSNAEQAESARSGGTLPYMAPEQLSAFLDPDRWDDVGPAADLYALGLVMVELLTGRRPEGPNPELPLPRAIRALLDRRLLPPSSPRVNHPEIPHTLASILLRCLNPNPAHRYASGEALADDLERFLDDRPVPSASGVPRSERAARWFRRHRVVLTTLNLVLALSCPVAVGMDFWRKPPVVDPTAFVASGNDRLDQGRELLRRGHSGEARKTFDLARSDYLAAIQQDHNLYSSYAGLAFIEANVNQNLERSIALQKQAIQLASRENTTVPIESRAELVKNLAVVALRRFRARIEQDSTWKPSAQDIALVEMVRERIRQISHTQSHSEHLKLFTRFDMLFRGALLQSQLADRLKFAGEPQKANGWYRSALTDFQAAMEQIVEIGPSGNNAARTQYCQQMIDNLRKEIESSDLIRPARLSAKAPS